jgi:hypothetical protein
VIREQATTRAAPGLAHAATKESWAAPGSSETPTRGRIGALRAALLCAALSAPFSSAAAGTDCAPARPVGAATYVALAGDLLLRLQVEVKLEAATLIVNRVDGNRLYDRRYWSPSNVGEQCGVRTIDYVERDPDGAGPARLRLTLQPPESVRRPGLPRAVTALAGELALPAGTRAVQFEEVVVKREVGGARERR